MGDDSLTLADRAPFLFDLASFMHSSHKPSSKFAQSEHTHFPPLHLPQTHLHRSLSLPASLGAIYNLEAALSLRSYGTCDQYTRDRIAGLSVPDPASSGHTANGYNRNHVQNTPTNLHIGHKHLNGVPQRPLPSVMWISPKPLGLLRTVRRRRDELITKRKVVDIHRRNFLGQLSQVEEAQEAFLEIAGRFMAKHDDVASGSTYLASLRKAWDDLQHSHSIIAADRNKFLKADDELNNSEEVLFKRENKLYRFFTEIESLSQNPNASFDDNLSYSPSSESDPQSLSRTSSEAVPPLVDEYYDKVGRTDYLRDEWLNLRADHQRQLALRERSRELGDTVEPSEFSFLQSYYKERQAHLQEYEDARQEMWSLFHECREKGYIVDEPGIPPLPDEAFFQEPNGLPSRIVQRTVLSPPGEDFPEVTSPDALVEDPTVQEKVSLWLHEQPMPDPDTTNRVDSMEAWTPVSSP